MQSTSSINFGVELVHLPALFFSLLSLIAVVLGPRNLGLYVRMLFGWLFGSAYNDVQPIDKSNRRSRVSDKCKCIPLYSKVFSWQLSVTPHSNYPGLRNSSGVHCFLNSTIQSLASLDSLESFLEELLIESDKLDIYLPLSEALWDTIQALNNPSANRAVHTNTAVINAFSLSNTSNTTHMSPSKRALSLIQSGQQDAQEMFQCISSMLAHEESLIKSAKSSVGGLGSISTPTNTTLHKNSFPLAGLTASRLADLGCGYVEAIRNIPFDALSLNLPMQTSCNVEQLLTEYTAMETIEDASCRKCSLEATLVRLRKEVERLMPADPNSVSGSRRRKIKEAAKYERRLSSLLSEDGDLQEDARLKDIRIDRSGGGSTKQLLIARPPQILGLHINRSAYLGNGMAVKNPCKIVFGELLDITSVTTTGTLETSPRKPISSASKDMLDNLTKNGTLPNRILYTLKSIVVHYGSHYSGHYVTYRKISSDDDDDWLRTSDSSVEKVTLKHVLHENPFMIFYERVDNASSDVDDNILNSSHILSSYSLHN
ncbi:cysteine proteinase [Wallemia mellicola]|uniref:ubiquitinyl hydrolase 1 n=1 Tax=Wallemia mellicola TaxID=1708541 RepID=A0AB74K9B5_9BASI|nr:cysteine proteinase [Wallemia mellicola]